MVLLLLSGYRYVHKAERSLVEAQLRFRVSVLAQVVEERIAVSVQALQTLANSQAAMSQDWHTLYDNAKRVADTNAYYDAVVLVDANQRVMFDTSKPYAAAVDGVGQPEWLKATFGTQGSNVTGPFKRSSVGDYVVAVCMPLVHQGNVTHLLRMFLRTDSINQLLQAQNLPSGWIAAIADREGTLLARSVSPESFVGQPGSQSFRAAIQRNDQKIYRGVALERATNTALVMPIHHNSWFLAVAVPDPVLEQVYQRNLLLVGTAIGVMCILAFGVAVGVSRFFSNQALALEKVVSTGRADTPLPWPLKITELQKVYLSYRDVSVRAQRAQGDLTLATHEKDEITDLYDHAPCGYHSLDAHGVVVRMNQTELNWLGRTRQEVIGKPFLDFITEAGKETFRSHYPTFLAQGHIENLEFDLIRSDGSLLPVSISGTLIRDSQGRPLMSRSTVFDITERKRLEQHLQELSRTDALTGLPNRRHFYDVVTQELERIKRYGHQSLVLAMMDVDHFKKINDEHGHAVGDEVLKQLASASRAALRQTDVLARIGGEEFVVMMPHTDIQTGTLVLDRLRETLQAQKIMSDQGAEIVFTVSIGVTALTESDSDVDATLKRADDALYEAKRLGRNQIRLA